MNLKIGLNLNLKNNHSYSDRNVYIVDYDNVTVVLKYVD